MPFQTDDAWTPSTYRAALAAWHANAPDNDGDIIPLPRMSRRPRHAAMAAEMAPLRMWMSPPTGEPITTNWRASPANDNRAPADFAAETAREILPSLPALRGVIDEIPMTHRPEPQILAGGRLEVRRADRETHGTPAGPDVEYGAYADDDGREHRVIVRIGPLQFSNGAQTEKAYRRTVDGGLEQYDVRMPVGAMLFTNESIARTKGGFSARGETNGYIASALKADPIEHKPGSRTKRTGPGRNFPNPPLPKRSMSLAEARAFAGLPPAEKNPKPVLPAGSPSLSGLFMSLGVGSSGKGSPENWQDNFASLVSAEQWRAVVAKLSRRSVQVLDAAMTAENFGDIGAVAGHEGDYARKAGKAELVAANDDLRGAIENIAA